MLSGGSIRPGGCISRGCCKDG